MKTLFFITFLFLGNAFAAVDSYTLNATVKKFDLKTVVLEVAGGTYTLSREKLGQPARNLTVGEKFQIVVDKSLAKK